MKTLYNRLNQYKLKIQMNLKIYKDSNESINILRVLLINLSYDCKNFTNKHAIIYGI
jgi:hypothetical protein